MLTLAAEARVFHVSYDLGEVNQEHFAPKSLIGGVQHLSEEISYGGRHSIVKRAPLVPFPFPLGILKKIKKSGPFKPLIAGIYALCIASSGGACFAAGK